MWDKHLAHIPTGWPEIVMKEGNFAVPCEELWCLWTPKFLFITVNFLLYGQKFLCFWDFLNRLNIIYENCNKANTGYTGGIIVQC